MPLDHEQRVLNSKLFFGKLYRYITVTDDKDDAFEQLQFNRKRTTTRERVYELIALNKIFAPKPSALNDPFECAPSVPIAQPRQLRKAFKRSLSQHLRETKEKLTSTQKSHFLSGLMVEHSDTEFRVRSMASQFDKNIGVISFSENWDSITQWSYYAGNHSGICLEFEVKNNAPWWQAFKGPEFAGFVVEYVKVRPEFDVSKIVEGKDKKYIELAGLSALICKAEAWKAENEVRLITNASKHFDYPQSALTGIIFGCRTNEEVIEFIIDTVNQSKSSPWIAKCQMSSTEYKLEKTTYSEL